MAERRWFVAVVAAMLLHASLPGCATTQPKSELYEMVGHGELTLGALRVIIRDCARRFPAVLEVAATTLGEGPTTAEQRQAPHSSSRPTACPMVQSVLLQQDPVAALLDGWALLYQLRDFLVRGAMDGPGLPETVRTVEGLADELARLWAALTGRPDVAPARARVEAWAREHPLRGSLLARDSTAPLLASLLGREQLSLRGAAGSAVESMQDAIARDRPACPQPAPSGALAGRGRRPRHDDVARGRERGRSFDRALDRAFDARRAAERARRRRRARSSAASAPPSSRTSIASALPSRRFLRASAAP